MREKLATLPLTQLKELAKSQGIKNISGLRKAELIDRLCETAESADSKKAAAGNSENRESTAVPTQGTAAEAAASGNGFGSARTESAHRRGRLRHRSVQIVRNIQDARREPNAMRDLIVRTAASAR